MSNGYYRPTGFQVLPPVVKNLLIINGLAFLATIALQRSLGIDLIDKFGLRYMGAEKFAPYQFITYMFLHADFTHIFFNMFALWMFGNALENVWGPRKFLIYYLATGIGAAIVHYITIYLTLRPDLTLINRFLADPGIVNLNDLIANISQPSGEILKHFNGLERDIAILNHNPDNYDALQRSIELISEYKTYFLNLPNVIGASGAVFGILLAFGMIFPNYTIYIYFAIPIKAKWFVILYGLLELYLGFTQSSSNVAHFAHLGGMIFGYFLIILWRYKNKPNHY